MKALLGLNSVFHESSAALIVEGKLAALVEEERFSRVRHGKKACIDHTPILPYRAIDEALRTAGLRFEELDLVAYSYDPEARSAALPRLPKDFGVPEGDYGSSEGERRFKDLAMMTGPLLSARYGTAKPVRYLPHHACHLASAYCSCPWDETAVLSVDGIGETDTCSWGRGMMGRLVRLGGIEYPHSLGFLWEKVTQWMGFSPNHEEGTVMALAAYGDPARFAKALRALLRPNPDGTFTVDPELARFRAQDVDGLETVFGPRRLPEEPLQYQTGDRLHADAAAALQELTEEVLLNLARRVREEAGLPRLALSGGVALNCLANGNLARAGVFDELWAFPAAADCGTAFGAACLAWAEQHGPLPREEWAHAYKGASERPGAVERALAARRLKAIPLSDEQIVEKVARLLAKGKTVAWYEGVSEVGPRALCHRSILADPRKPEMRDHLNSRIKHRLPFRPYGPVVRAEDALRYFDIPASAMGPCRFMLAAVPVRPEARERIPAVAHEDGTTRPQLVTKAVHPRLHALLGAFGALTDVPVLVNTSFNDREPVVGTPQHAVDTWLRTELDALVLEDRLLVKP
ncbi:MAG TPA: carbamoyltransferase [Elusimicrobia bacterium]|nr:carbamoyltransferase [Elusimicrobiota bacterium]